MSTELIINATLPETRIALLENNEIQELHIERDSEKGIVGNIYKGKVIRVLPGMQAAFVDIGLEKAAFLYVDDIFFPEMDKPLVSPPLPDPKPQQPRSAIEVGPNHPSQRGRGGRPSRPGRTEVNAEQALSPGSPEDHAAMQAEYAKQMLNEDGVVEGEASVVRDAALPTGVEVESIASTAAPEQRDQPVARSPEPTSADLADLDDDEDEAEGSAVYRPEPIIDAEAWAEDIKAQEEPVSEEVVVVAEAVEGVVVAEAGASALIEDQENAPADMPEQSVAAQQHSEVSAEEAVSAEGETPKLMVPPVAPLATPIPVQPQGRGGRRGGKAEAKSEAKSSSVEDEDDSEEMPRRRRRREPVNIADLVREGQEILVQVAKDPIGTKGARLTCHVSLPGRYLVFMPTVDHIGVSRRIESDGERRRLKETISKIRPAGTGVIVRTASGKQTDKKLKADIDYLVTTWNDIQRKFKKQRTPSAVYQDLTIVLRAIRDMFTDEVDKVVVDSRREHKAIMKFVTRFIPNVKDKVELYSGDMPIFDAYGIETEISRALERKVWLKSGGYLVVDQAEALVAIDVNTGRYVGKKTLEETILRTNLEAVKEIAYQLRLRNCGGIIILDLIDMEKEANKEKVYKALEEALKKDRARPSILKISQLGLIEMTRKRTRDSIVRSLCEPCSYCEGRGFVKNKLTIAYDIMRDMEREGGERSTSAISIQCHPTVADELLEDKRDVIEDLERQFNKKITIRGNGAYHVEQYELVAHRDQKNLVWSSEERRQMLRQRIQERQQRLAADARKQNDEKKNQQRKEADERRRERQAQAEERRRIAAEKRRELQAAVGSENPEAQQIQEGLEPELGPDTDDFEGEEGEERGPGVGNPAGGEQDPNRSRRRRRRGRRGGRGRRGRTGQPGGPQQTAVGPTHPPRVIPVQVGSTDDAPGNPTSAAPSQERLSAVELGGSVGAAGPEGDEAQGLGANADPSRRKRRRGRRGGRRRRFGRGGPRPPGQPGQNAGPHAGGGEGGSGGGGGSSDSQ